MFGQHPTGGIQQLQLRAAASTGNSLGMETSVVYRLISLPTVLTQGETSHTGVLAVIRLASHDAVARTAVATTGKRVVIIAAGGIKNIADTAFASRKWVVQRRIVYHRQGWI